LQKLLRVAHIFTANVHWMHVLFWLAESPHYIFRHGNRWRLYFQLGQLHRPEH